MKAAPGETPTPTSHNLTGDPLLDVQLVDVRRVLEEAFADAAARGEMEPVAYLLDTELPIAREIAQHLFGAPTVAERERFGVTRFVGYVWRDDLAHALNDAINMEAALLLRDVPLHNPELWTIAVFVPEVYAVATVSRSALLSADVSVVVSGARQAGWVSASRSN